VDFKLVSFGGGPSVENGVEDSASNAWCCEVSEFGQSLGGPVRLPGRCALPYVGRNAVVSGVVVESPSGHFVVDSGGGVLQQGGENRLVDRGLVYVLLLACGVPAVVDMGRVGDIDGLGAAILLRDFVVCVFTRLCRKELLYHLCHL